MIQLIIKINFISSKNFIDTRDIHSKSDNVEIMMYVDTNQISKNLFLFFFTKISKRTRRINERK